MAVKKKKSGFGTLIALVLFLAVWLIMLDYGHWYFYTGWTEQNAIMRYCSQFNDTDLGWWKYIFGHGVLNFVAGYVAVFPLLVPLVSLIMLFRRKTVLQGIKKITKLFFNALSGVVMIVGLLYGALYFMEQLPLLAGFLFLIGICSLIPTGKSILIIVIEE